MITSPENNVVFVSFIEGTEDDRQTKLEQFLSDDVARWASKRARLIGDIIIPKHACINLSGTVNSAGLARSHASYYVEHSGISPRTEERFHRHHVVCDCVLKKDFNDGRGGVNTKACPDLHMATVLRARRFGNDIRPDISASQELETDPYKILVLSDRVAVAAIETALSVDDITPEVWPGTVVSGKLHIEQAAEMTGQSEEDIAWYADILQSTGKVSFDGQSFKLAA